jgi:hypothetical protein
MALRLKVRIAEGQKAYFRIPPYSENDSTRNTKSSVNLKYHGKALQGPSGKGQSWNTSAELFLRKPCLYALEYANQGKSRYSRQKFSAHGKFQFCREYKGTAKDSA